MSTPLIGSDAWVEERILATFVKAREAIDAHLEEFAGGRDLDHYFYLRIPRRHRKFWRIVLSLSEDHRWIHPWKEGSDIIDIAPSAGKISAGALRAASEVLRSEGLPATFEERWR